MKMRLLSMVVCSLLLAGHIQVFAAANSSEILNLSYAGKDADNLYGQTDTGEAVAIPVNPNTNGYYMQVAGTTCYQDSLGLGDVVCIEERGKKTAMSDIEFYDKYSVTPKQAAERLEQLDGRRSSNPKADYEYYHRTSSTPRQKREQIRAQDEFDAQNRRLFGECSANEQMYGGCGTQRALPRRR